MFAREIGIDLGSANTTVVARRRGIIAREPSVVAVNRRTKSVVAVGQEARNMVGRTPDTIMSVRPVQGGVISDMDHSTALLKHLIRKISGSRWLKPRVVLTMQANASEVDKRALAEAAVQAGAGEVLLVQETVAAAIGAGLPVDKPEGSLLVDIGSGTTDVAVIALGGVVVSTSASIAGDLLDEAVARYLKKEHNLLIGAPTAERVKIELGSALPGRTGTTTVTGRLVTTGLPTGIKVTAEEIHGAIAESLVHIDHLILSVIERTPPELLADISTRGITLTGGSALLHGMSERVAQVTNLPVRVAESPLEAVAMGTEKLLEQKSRVNLYRIKG